MYDRKIMKRLIWVILFLIFTSILVVITGCNNAQKLKEVHTSNVDSLPNANYSIYIIDSCEYVIFHNGNATWGSHKGDCENPVHNR